MGNTIRLKFRYIHVLPRTYPTWKYLEITPERCNLLVGGPAKHMQDVTFSLIFVEVAACVLPLHPLAYASAFVGKVGVF